MTIGRWAVATVLALSSLGGGVARAESASCEIPIVHAMHNGDDGRAPEIDPQINKLRPYLLKAPFTAWREFKLLGRPELTIPQHGSQSFELPNGRTASLTFIGHSSGPGDHRLRLRLLIEDKSKKDKMVDTTFVLDEGGFVLHVGQRYEGGILILAVSCKTHD
jgi:hypothetical protein